MSNQNFQDTAWQIAVSGFIRKAHTTPFQDRPRTAAVRCRPAPCRTPDMKETPGRFLCPGACLSEVSVCLLVRRNDLIHLVRQLLQIGVNLAVQEIVIALIPHLTCIAGPVSRIKHAVLFLHRHHCLHCLRRFRMARFRNRIIKYMRISPCGRRASRESLSIRSHTSRRS